MIEEVLIGPLGWAIIICPECGEKSSVKPGKELQNKILDRTCTCGLKYQLIFDMRSASQKKCSFPGILLSETDVPVTLQDISEKGASFECNAKGINVGSFYNLKIKVKKDWVEILIRIKIVRIDRKLVGVEFVKLSADQKKTIESYILAG
jgi:hypothetical protein